MTVALVVTSILLIAALAALWLLRARMALLRAEIRAEQATAGALRDRIAGLEREVAAGTARGDGLTQEISGLRESNQKLTEAAETIIEDLREPLGKVIEFLEPMERPRYAEQLDYRSKHYVQFARDAALRMRALIEDRIG